MKWDYTFISAQELIEIQYGRRPVPPGAVWLSFDDGCRELLASAIPIAQQYRIPITLFIPSGIIEGDGLLPWLHSDGGPTYAALIESGVRDCMTVSELAEIAQYAEVTIGSHTVNHGLTLALPEERRRFEFAESKRSLEWWIRSPVTCFAYPEGRYSGDEGRLLKECGYQLAASTESRVARQECDPYLIPRFHVGDNISFPEAICNIVGVWRPTLDSLLTLMNRCGINLNRVRWFRGTNGSSAKPVAPKCYTH